MSDSSDSLQSSSEDEKTRASAQVSGNKRQRTAAAAAAAADTSSSSSSDSSSDSSSSSDDEEAEPVQPITDARMVTIDLAKLNPSFTCKLCGGYLRDAHTLRDCLHTFCRSCLERYIVHTRRNDVVHCPYRASAGCTTALIATHPMRTEVRQDRTIQNLIDKLLPQYVRAEEELKKQLEAQYGGKKTAPGAVGGAASTATSHGIEPAVKKQKFGEEKFGHDKLMIFELRPYVPPPSAASSGAAAASTTATPAPLPALANPFVKASSKITVKLLRKFVAESLALPADQSALDIQCSGEVLGQDHSVEFIWRTRWNHTHPNQHLVLTYRPQTHQF